MSASYEVDVPTAEEIAAARDYYGSGKCIEHGIGACVVCWRSREDRQRFVGPGVKLDKGKPRLDMWRLLPPLATQEVAEVLEFGRIKYSAWGWQKVLGWRWRYTAAALRHIFLGYLAGVRTDDGPGGSKRHHLACALCSLLFILDNELRIEAGATDVPDGDAEERP